MRRAPLLLICLPIFVCGCHTGTLPNPNNPHDVGNLSVENIQDQLGCISESLQTRLAHRQISNREFQDLMQKAADSLLVGFNPDNIDVTKTSQMGQILITARHWEQAKPVLEAAVEAAKMVHDEDRRVNDSLRLARVLAELGKVPEAIKTARTVFNVKPQEGAPILYATSEEIVPAAYGKGSELELAKLLEDAIAIDLRVQVDLSRNAGQEFVRFRPRKVSAAWMQVADLYRSANRPDLASAAEKKAQAAAKSFLESPAIRDFVTEQRREASKRL